MEIPHDDFADEAVDEFLCALGAAEGVHDLLTLLTDNHAAHIDDELYKLLEEARELARQAKCCETDPEQVFRLLQKHKYAA